MKKKLLSLFALIAALFAGTSDTHAQKSKPQKAKTQTAESGVLYKITGKNLKKPSYLFGTFHLICEKDLFPPATIKNYVAQTDKLMLELDLTDPAVMQQATAGAMLENGKTARDFLKPEDYAKLDALYKNYLGISYDNLQTFKPFMASTVLMMSPKIIGCQAVPGFDKILANAAKENKLPVVGLETVADEYAAINAQPLEKQFAGLVKIAASPEKAAADFQTLYKTYLTQNTDEVYKFMLVQMTEEPGTKEKLLDERNAKWLPVIEKNITGSSAFIAVGDGHLGGEKGVINLLRKRGYKLTPIKIS